MWHLEKIKKINEEANEETPPQEDSSEEIRRELLEAKKRLAELSEKLSELIAKMPK